MKNLVIVESPSKSKTIEKYLGADFEVVSSKGHIRDLATRGKEGLGVDVENDFAPTYSISKEKAPVVKELKAKAKKADFVYLATDPDREGEAISWHLADELDVDLNELNRVEFHEITKDAVLEAFKHPRKVDMDLVHSQETRRILDRIIGFKLSKLLHSKIKSKSAGRVQSV
ncbi:MAG: DNA topoisomerase I, partial [Erysipelotrichaceae bacterium]|nr:DNA topoisomerase I [Erysipelotrichaceae bacterium]